MVLSKPEILRHIKEGNIVFDPFDEASVNTSSVDVTLGEWYFREQDPSGGNGTFNIYDRNDVRRVWGSPITAKASSLIYDGIEPRDKIIMLAPGETILAHTREFIGGKRCITTKMQARSSMGRSFIAVCKCAGMGDVGFINRWTMEITNFSTKYHIPLVAGRRIAQIVFFEVEPLDEDYSTDGKYQKGTDLDEVRSAWNPSMMLPRLYDDREVK